MFLENKIPTGFSAARICGVDRVHDVEAEKAAVIADPSLEDRPLACAERAPSGSLIAPSQVFRRAAGSPPSCIHVGFWGGAVALERQVASMHSARFVTVDVDDDGVFERPLATRDEAEDVAIVEDKMIADLKVFLGDGFVVEIRIAPQIAVRVRDLHRHEASKLPNAFSGEEISDRDEPSGLVGNQSVELGFTVRGVAPPKSEQKSLDMQRTDDVIAEQLVALPPILIGLEHRVDD